MGHISEVRCAIISREFQFFSNIIYMFCSVELFFEKLPVFNTHHIPAPAVDEQMSSPGLPEPFL